MIRPSRVTFFLCALTTLLFSSSVLGNPWVIALAQTRQLTEVTGETGSGKIDKPKIPDVCKALNLPCIGIVDFFKKQGLRI
jgi:hypothetical protein